MWTVVVDSACPRRVTYIHICSTAHPRPRPRVRNKDFIIISSILGRKNEKLENALLVLVLLHACDSGIAHDTCASARCTGLCTRRRGVSRAGISGGGGDWGRPNNTGAPPRQRGLRLWPSHSPILPRRLGAALRRRLGRDQEVGDVAHARPAVAEEDLPDTLAW